MSGSHLQAMSYRHTPIIISNFAMLYKLIPFSLSNRLLIMVSAVLLMVAGHHVVDRTEGDVLPELTAPTVAVMT